MSSSAAFFCFRRIPPLKLLPFQVIQRNMPDPRKVFRRLSAVDFSGIFTKSNVQRPVKFVLDIPMLAGRFGKLLGAKIG